MTTRYPLVLNGTSIQELQNSDSLILPSALSISSGGTGLSSYTAGDLSYFASGTALTKLAIGTNGYILQSTGSAPSWVAASTVVGGAAGSNTQVQFNNSGALGASANLTFNGTTLTANTIGAFTLGGTIAGGGNQINNVIIGTTTPLAGAFTTLTASSTLSVNSTEATLQLNTTGQKAYALISGGGGNLTNGYFAIRNNTNSNNPFYIDPSAPANCVYISSTGLAVTGTLSATGVATFLSNIVDTNNEPWTFRLFDAYADSQWLYTQKVYNQYIGSSGDPSSAYVLLCEAYQNGATQNKTAYTGYVYWQRGSAGSGNFSFGAYVMVSAAYNSNSFGGKAIGGGQVDICQVTYSSVKYLAVRSPYTSSGDVYVSGFSSSAIAPTLVSDGSVSAVTVLQSLAP